MKLFLLAVLAAGAAFAQTTTITVTITVPAAAGPVVNAWLNKQCATFQADGVTCATKQYANAKEFVQSLVTPPINQALLQIFNWAVATQDASLPAAVKTAISSQSTAQTTIQSGAVAAAPTVGVQ